MIAISVLKTRLEMCKINRTLISGTVARTVGRLVGRSVWNTRWKLVIPGKTLLNDPEEGLDRFINSVTDVKVHFETYSYSGN